MLLLSSNENNRDNKKKDEIMSWYIGVLKKYAVFKGRARRKEYWYFLLFNILISIALIVIEGVIGWPSAEAGTSFLWSIYTLAIIIPSIAVLVRRLHDTDRSGWYIFVFMIPFIGAFILLFFLVQDSKPGENQFGPNPKGVSMDPLPQSESTELDRKKRPTSVTVIAWFLIATYGYTLASLPLFLSPEFRQIFEEMGMGISIAVSVLLTVVNSVLGVVSGIAMLKGFNWGRLLYLWSVPILTVLYLVLTGFHFILMSILSLIFYLVVLVFLTRPAASTFFTGGASVESES